MEDLGTDGQEVAREFRHLAKVNLYAVEILSGKTELLDNYVRFLQSYPKGLLNGLIVIMQTALCYGLKVDEQLSYLNDDINEIKSDRDKITQSKYRKFCNLVDLYKIATSPRNDHE
ncbi:hypothetical protein D3C75_774600 [compost metagenome]